MASNIHDVAAEAGVSIATVSRVIAGNYPVAKKTRERVELAVAKLNYSANPNAQRLRGVDIAPVAVLLGSITGPSFAALAQGVEAEARDRGRICLIGTTGSDYERELELVELMRRQGVEAVILPGGVWASPDHHDRMAALAKTLAKEGKHLVFCGPRTLEDHGEDAIDIRYDNEGGAREIAAHVVAKGHRNVLLMSGVPNGATAIERLRGFRSALEAGGAQEYGVIETSFDREPAREALLAHLREIVPVGSRPPFTAVLCGTDQVAMGVLDALHEHGLRCPEDVSITGFDDVPSARDLSPALTTIRVPYEELGALAVRHALDDPRTTAGMLPVELVVRDSVAAPR